MCFRKRKDYWFDILCILLLNILKECSLINWFFLLTLWKHSLLILIWYALKKETNIKEIPKPYLNDEKRPLSEQGKPWLMKNETQQLSGFEDLRSPVLFRQTIKSFRETNFYSILWFSLLNYWFVKQTCLSFLLWITFYKKCSFISITRSNCQKILTIHFWRLWLIYYE